MAAKEQQKQEQNIGMEELKRAAAILQKLLDGRFMTVELQRKYDDELNEVTSAQFAIASPPKRGHNSETVLIRFHPITSHPLEMFDVTEANGSYEVTAKK